MNKNFHPVKFVSQTFSGTKKKRKSVIIISFLIIFLFNSALPFSVGFRNSASAQGTGYTPRYPERLKYIIGEINQSGKDLVYLNQNLKNLTESCSCSNSQSQCGREDISMHGCTVKEPQAIGETCPDRKEIKKTQTAIKNKVDDISYLRKLLIKEKESGLGAELKTLREDEGNQLKNGLENLINFTQEIVSPSISNVEILDNEEYSAQKQCRGDCHQGLAFKLVACILKNLGQQDPIKIIFEVGAALEKLDLGEISFFVKPNLPDKIDLSNIDKLKDIKVYLPDINASIDEIPSTENAVVIHPPSPKAPALPTLNFPCPLLDNKTYNCRPEEKRDHTWYIKAEWYFQTFSWLSQKCQELPGMGDIYGMPNNQCLDMNNVHSAIIRKCDSLWSDYLACEETGETFSCTLPPGICAKLGPSGVVSSPITFRGGGEGSACSWGSPCTREEAEEIQCQKLLGHRCNLAALQAKCEELKREETKTVPEPCKFIPLFTGIFKNPGTQEYQAATSSCSPQNVSDNTGFGVRMDCPLSFPSIPKIKLPSIKIPDIYMPTFSFMPFFKIKLPNFIFEDLNLPDLELCNIDKCKNLIPPFLIKIPYPSLSIPSVKIPPIPIPAIPRHGEAINEIRVDNINFPPIPIPLPSLDLTKLLTASIQLPEIPLPRPKITLRLTGIKINAFNLLLGLVAHFIDIPSGCISASISYIPLIIGFPDYHFYWPKFPEIPDFCNNKYIHLNDFCEKVKTNSGIAAIEPKAITALSEAINGLQTKLDSIAETYNELISSAVSHYITSHISVIGRTIRIVGGEIYIPMARINEKLAEIPHEIPIPWPADLEEIASVKAFSIKLPSLPLDKIGYSKKVEINVPGFQLPNITIALDLLGLGNYASCTSGHPSGGNPYPMGKINANLNRVQDIFNNEINTASTNINQILK